MSKAQERIAEMQKRIAALLSGLDASASSQTGERDAKVIQLLLSAAEYTAMADDISESGPELGHLLAGEAVEMASGERTILLGISLGNDACGLIALPPLHIGHNEGACISPDPSTMFPGQDANRPQPKEQGAEKKNDAKPTPAAGTTDGASRQAQQLFQPSSSDPDEALEELSSELLMRAERLLEQAEKLEWQEPATQPAVMLTCSTADYR